MLYVFVGKDLEKRKKAFQSDLERFSEYEKSYLDETNFSPSAIQERLESQNLFGHKMAVILHGVLEKKDIRDSLLPYIKAMDESEHAFFFLESNVSKTDMKSIGQKGGKIKFLDESSKKSPKFNIFSITDAVGRKDKKATWVMLQKAVRHDVSHADIANILIWHFKNMLVAKGRPENAKEAAKTGLNPFVFKKSVSFSRGWTEGELKSALKDMVFLYHNDRRGQDLAQSLELFLLKTL